MTEFCIHYPRGGMGIDKKCEEGIDFASVRAEASGCFTYPCFNDQVRTCAQVKYPTPDQIAEREAYLARRLKQLGDFSERKSDLCFHCGKKVDRLRQVGRCVYAIPCGCRLWQGQVPKAWKEKE